MSARGPAAPSVEELLDEIMQAPYGMPVRLMEAVVDRGAAAVPAVVRALEQWDEEDDGDALWLVVLLGVLGDERAVPALIAVMRRTDLDLLAPAAAEALAMIGAPAVPALLDVGRSGEPLERLHAYAALGWIQSDAAYAGLIEALGRDLPMADVLAIALISHQRREAVPAIYAAYRQCEPWQRTDLEDALRTIDRGDVDPPLWRSDWRLRYRRQPDLGDAIAPEWHTVSALFREDAELRARRPLTELSTLDDILAAPDAVDEPAVCQECGQVLEWPMGVAICPDTAVAIGLFQLEILTRAREDGIDDVFELLDELEDEEMQLLEEKEREDEVEDAREPTPQAEERADRIQELAEARATACWLVEQGIESVEEGEAAIARELPALAERHGDPDHLLAPLPPVRASVKVGRNDPCPCGSGRKYKRCCLDRE